MLTSYGVEELSVAAETLDAELCCWLCCDDEEVFVVFMAESSAALKRLCVMRTTAIVMTDKTMPAMPSPFPFFFPLLIPTMPTIPNMTPRMPRKNDPLLMIGRNEVAIPMMPRTSDVTAMADVGSAPCGC